MSKPSSDADQNPGSSLKNGFRSTTLFKTCEQILCLRRFFEYLVILCSLIGICKFDYWSGSSKAKSSESTDDPHHWSLGPHPVFFADCYVGSGPESPALRRTLPGPWARVLRGLPPKVSHLQDQQSDSIQALSRYCFIQSIAINSSRPHVDFLQ